jgi:hypothetical protein
MVIEKLVTPDVVRMNYTWTGKTTILPLTCNSSHHHDAKRPFNQLKNIQRVVFLATQKGHKLSEDDVKKGIHDYLKRVSYRTTQTNKKYAEQQD